MDLDLIRIAYGNIELRPLVAQFTYGKDNLKGRNLKDIADETAVLYGNVIDWASAVKHWYDTLRQVLRLEVAKVAA